MSIAINYEDVRQTTKKTTAIPKIPKVGKLKKKALDN